MWLKICGGALLCAVAVVVLRTVKADVLPLQWTGIVLLGGATLVMWQPVLAWLGDVCAAHGLSDMSTLLLKGLGVGVLTQTCADLCRQTGEGTLAGGVETAGRAELLLLCLPLLKHLMATAAEWLGALP